MNKLKNSVRLMGNLGMDPEVRTLENGRVLARLSLATSETLRNAEGKAVNKTQWHNLVAWGHTARIAAKYLKKGSRISVQGKLVHRNYKDAHGVIKYITEIIVDDLSMITRPQKQGSIAAS